MISLSRLHRASGPARSALLKFAARWPIFAEGDPADAFCEVVSGKVMLHRMLPCGRRLIIDVLQEGDFAGISRTGTHGAGALTLSAASLALHARASLEHDGGLQARVTANLLTQQHEQREHMMLLGTASARARVAGLFLNDRLLRKCAPLNLSELADYLGLRAETVSRQVSALHKAGAIARTGWGSYAVKDASSLRAIALAAV